MQFVPKCPPVTNVTILCHSSGVIDYNMLIFLVIINHELIMKMYFFATCGKIMFVGGNTSI